MGRKKGEGKNSVDIVAVEQLREDIVTADELYGDGMPYEIDAWKTKSGFTKSRRGRHL